MVIPGYSESLSHNRELVDILARMGYDAFTFRPPRRKAVPIESVLDRQKDIILGILKAIVPEGEKVYAVAHSLGSAALLKAARDTPNRFIELILMQPPGLTGELSFSTLLRRVSKKTVQNTASTLRDRHLHRIKRQPGKNHRPRSATTRKLLRAQASSGYFIAKNPVLALREAHAARQYDITSDATVARKSGIPVHVIRAPGDELFSPTKTGPKSERIMHLEGAYSNLADIHAPHDTFWLHAERTAEIVDGIIREGDGPK